MASVWVIEQGEYSDYRVVGVFSTAEAAEEVAAAINHDSMHYPATVAEWPLDPAVNELRQGFTQWVVRMRKDGMVEQAAQNETIDSYNIAGEVSMWRRSEAPAFVGKGVQDALTATVWAKDIEHAVKIANEHRAQMIASGQWDGQAVAS